MSDVVIEAMAGRHIEAVMAIDRRCYSQPWSAATWRDELAADNRTHLVARVDDRVVAHAGSLLIVDELHITTVATDPDAEGRGHGTRLCLDLLEAGRRAGAVAATLEVRAAARRTQRMYSRLGFAPAGLRPGYFDKPTDDAIIMWLHDLAGEEQRDRWGRIARELDTSSRDEGALR